jgi:hypothetical protein
MQTFLPVADFKSSAQMLDYRRLGKQRLEAAQLVRAITEGGGWSNHPAARMWAGHVRALKKYHDICVDEWVRRGYRNTMLKFNVRTYTLPPWFGDDQFHSAHRAALLHKDFEFYRKYDWKEKPALDYLWPVFV